MNKYKYGVTKEMAEWAIDQGLATEEELMNYNEYDADTLIACYNIHHNKKCFTYSKMVESASGIKMFDSVLGYLHEDYDSAKERERLEKEDIMNMRLDEED